MIHGAAGVRVGKALLDSLTDIDLAREVVPAGVSWELIDEALGVGADVVDVAHS